MNTLSMQRGILQLRARLPHQVCRVSTRAQSTQFSTQERLLNAYWESRGIFEEPTRVKLVGLAMESLSSGDDSDGADWAPLDTTKPLPGVPVTWDHESGTPEEVMEVSRRLLLLHQLLGGDASADDNTAPGVPPPPGSASVDEVVFMVVREPDLLTTDSAQLMSRLIQMKIASAGKGVDVVRCVVRQPALLTSDNWQLDALLNNNRGSSSSAGHRDDSSNNSDSDGSGYIQGPSTPLNPILADLRESSNSSSSSSSANSNSSSGAVDAGRTSSSSTNTSTSSRFSQQGYGYATHGGASDTDYGYGYGNDYGYGQSAMTYVTDHNTPAGSSEVAGSRAAGGAGQWSEAQQQSSAGPGAWQQQQQQGGGGGGSGVSVHVRDEVYELIRAWEHGLSADGDREWMSRFKQLASYVETHGDAGVGFRDQPHEAELGRWAAKQRADHKQGLLPDNRRDALVALGFAFDDDEAEWVRWYTELCAFAKQAGHSSPYPLSQGVDLRLINWVSIQRIAKRSKVLPASRIERLDQLAFDWTGADPLS